MTEAAGLAASFVWQPVMSSRLAESARLRIQALAIALHESIAADNATLTAA